MRIIRAVLYYFTKKTALAKRVDVKVDICMICCFLVICKGSARMQRKMETIGFLNGSKTFITNGWMSDTVIVVAVTNPQVSHYYYH